MKKIFVLMLLVCVLLVGAISCKNSPSAPAPSPSSDEPAKRPATLRLGYFTENYKKGDTQPKGTVYYTDENGKITTLSLQDAGVTTDFNATTAGENKTLKITYKGIDCVGTYNVYELEEVSVEGCFVVGDNTTYDFFPGSDKVVITKYTSWNQFMNFDTDPTETEATYTRALSSTGKTVIKVTEGEDTHTFYPDGNGGISTYGTDLDLPQPKIGEWYVSTTPEKGKVLPLVKGKYAAIRFTTDGRMKIWFTADISDGNLATLLAADTPDVTVAANFIKFGLGGVKIDTVTVDAANAKNFKMYTRNDFETFCIVSYSDDTYNGYDFALQLKKD